jgi:hypothetical protein
MNNKGLLLAIITLSSAVVLFAQGRGGAAQGGGAPAAQTARTVAPKDLTGTWVSVVAEHWHLRMLMPPKGEFTLIPVNAEARKVAMAYDAAKEPAADACKGYGAAAIMTIPGRLNIHWADDNTLQVDIDSGTQTRMLHFNAGAPPAAQASDWQGYSAAQWEGISPAELRARTVKSPVDVRGGLMVTTTKMRPGYLRKNGIPYSENARMEEHFDRFTEPNGDNWIVVDMILTDPQYLTQPYVTSNAFKKIPDRQGWDPTPCRVNEVR